jgi:alginate O-acetyltransferase complex protein AlgI
MTLGSFFTDYLYVPLGGNRGSRWRLVRNVMIVFLISGLWHGANYTFILWGALHGVAVAISRLIGTPKKRLWRFLSWLLTFLFINISWVLFRADSIQAVWHFFMALGRWQGLMHSAHSVMFSPYYTTPLAFFSRIIGFDSVYAGAICAALWLVMGLYFSVLSRNAGERLSRFQPTAWRMVLCVVIFVWSVLALSNVSRFLYYNF